MSNGREWKVAAGSENTPNNHGVADLKCKVNGFLVHLKNFSPNRTVQAEKPSKLKVLKTRKASGEHGTYASARLKINQNSVECLKNIKGSNKGKDEIKVKEIKENVPKRVLKVKIHPVPKLLTVVEDRAKQREQRLKEINLLKHEKQLALARELEEKVRLELEMEEVERLAKECEAKKMKEDTDIENKRIKGLKWLAIKHNNRRLVLKVFDRLRNKSEINRKKMLVLKEICWQKFSRKAFTSWKANVELKIIEDKNSAINFYQLKLFSSCLHHWQKICAHYSRSRQAAKNFWELKLSRNVFNEWQRCTRHQRKVTRQRTVIARKYYDRKLLETHFRGWKLFPAINKADQEKEKFKLILRMRVKEYLNDFETE